MASIKQIFKPAPPIAQAVHDIRTAVAFFQSGRNVIYYCKGGGTSPTIAGCGKAGVDAINTSK